MAVERVRYVPRHAIHPTLDRAPLIILGLYTVLFGAILGLFNVVV